MTYRVTYLSGPMKNDGAKFSKKIRRFSTAQTSRILEHEKSRGTRGHFDEWGVEVKRPSEG